MNRKGLLNLVIGIIIGASLGAALPAYGAIKQFVLTEFSRPVVVNGTKYVDKANPILEYKGYTYIPLAKIGDLTGLNYRWNSEKKQVEISSSSSGVAGREGDVLKPDSVIEEDEVPGYKGHADTEDPSYQWAITMQRAADDFPPLLSQGWISAGMLQEIEGIVIPMQTKPNQIDLVRPGIEKSEVLLSLTLPSEFNTKENGDFIISDIHIKKYYGNLFFSISDLKKARVIK